MNKNIDDLEITSEMVNEFLNDLEKRRKLSEKTLTYNYINWLVDYLNRIENHIVCDEDFLYCNEGDDNYNKVDVENSMNLSYLFLALANAKFPISEDDESYFPDSIIYFSYNGINYKIETVVGQGSVTIASICSKNECNNATDITTFLT